MRSKFREWYATQVQQQLHEGEDIAPVDLRMSIMKPLGARWLVSLYDYLKEHPSIIENGFKAAGACAHVTELSIHHYCTLVPVSSCKSLVEYNQ